MTEIKKNSIILQNKGGVSHIILNQPDKHNALSPTMIEELSDAFENLSKDENTRVLILSANGKSFCAGGDLDWMKRMANLSYEENHKDAMKLAVMLQKLDILPFPTIAAVNGAAFGGGVGLVSACDIAIGNEYAKFSLSEVRLGLIPATISPYVVRAVGSRNARYLFMTSNLIFPEEAHHLGLLTHYTQNNNFDNF